jgi:hypothetical protein
VELEINTTAERRGSLNTRRLIESSDREPSLIVRVGVLLGRLSDGFKKSWIFVPWLPAVLTDGFNLELPIITIVEKKVILAPTVGKASTIRVRLTLSLALSHISEQFVLNRRPEDIPGQFAVKTKSMVKIEAEHPNYRAGQIVKILCTQCLELSVNLRT